MSHYNMLCNFNYRILLVTSCILLFSACDNHSANDKEAFALGYAAAWSSQDPTKLAAHYAEDGYISVNGGAPSIGRDAIAKKAQGFMTAFPDMIVTLDKLEVKNNKVLFHWHWIGTNSGPGGSGKKLDIRGFEQWTFNDAGLIVESLGTYDKAEYERQMGLASLDKASKLAMETLIVDTHIDVPYRLQRKWEDVSVATKGGDFDFPRAVQGGLNVPFMSIYIPADYQNGRAYDFGNKMIDIVERMVKESPTKFAIAKSTSDLQKHFEQNLISLPLGMENGAPLEGDLENLKHFYERGIRYITLTHSKANHISDSSYDEERPNNGLSDFGKGLVGEMNKIGIMIDVSHISDAAFYQVMELSKVPVIASHSSLRHFIPGMERNMSDDMLKALKKNGGVIGINFGSFFLTKEANDWNKARNEFVGDAENVAEKRAEYRKLNPYPFATVDDVLDHIDRAVQIMGIDHVGLGSDYDGVGDSLPIGLKDASTFPNLIQGLLDRGYSDADIKKILSENMIRVWRAVEDYAKQN